MSPITIPKKYIFIDILMPVLLSGVFLWMIFFFHFQFWFEKIRNFSRGTTPVRQPEKGKKKKKRREEIAVEEGT